LQGSLPAGALRQGLRQDHHRDRPGRRVLLRRGLPPAVPGQEPGRLLRDRRHRRDLPDRRRRRGLSQAVTPASLEKAALSLPGAELSIKWGADRCYCVGGKMFAATDLDGGHFSLKVSDIAFEVLTETGRAKPA